MNETFTRLEWKTNIHWYIISMERNLQPCLNWKASTHQGIYIYIYIYIYKWMKPLTMFEWKADIHRTSMDKTFNKILNELTSIFTTTDETFKWPPKNQHPPISTSMHGTFNIHKKSHFFNNVFSLWFYLENLHGNLQLV